MSEYTSNQLFKVIDPITGIANNNPNRMIAPAKVYEILDDCRDIGVRAVQVTGGGEPTVHPHHVEIFQAIHERGLEFALVTNGTVFRTGLINILLKATWIRFSVDAGNADTYAKMRRVPASTYERVLENIRTLAIARASLRSRRSLGKTCSGDLAIGVSFVVTRDNYREIVTATEQAKAIGVDSMRISALFQSNDEAYFRDIYDYIRARCREARSLSDDRFDVIDNFGDRLSDLRQHNPDYAFCGHQHLTTYIGADLNVYRCCVLAYNNRGTIGSIKACRFKELWNSQAKVDDFKRFDARGCVRCMFNNKNRAILYAMAVNPAHVNFL